MLQQFIEQLQRELEIEESLATEVKGVYSFPVNETTAVLISELPKEGFGLTCSFGDIPAENQQDFFAQCLLANLMGKGTDSAVLGLDEEGEKLVLSKYVDTPVEYKEFKDFLEDFLNSVDFWVKEVQSYVTTKNK
jgi:hypothetical protein